MTDDTRYEVHIDDETVAKGEPTVSSHPTAQLAGMAIQHEALKFGQSLHGPLAGRIDSPYLQRVVVAVEPDGTVRSLTDDEHADRLVGEGALGMDPVHGLFCRACGAGVVDPADRHEHLPECMYGPGAEHAALTSYDDAADRLAAEGWPEDDVVALLDQAAGIGYTYTDSEGAVWHGDVAVHRARRQTAFDSDDLDAVRRQVRGE